MTEEKEKIKEKKLEDIKKEAEGKKCPVQKALYFVDEFLVGPMCGRCFPCSFGSYEARIRLRNLSEGAGSEEDVLRLKRIAENMLEASMCKKGKDTAKFIMDYIDTETFRGHLAGICPERECHSLIKYVILPEKCTMCGICLDVCKDNAIIGEKRKSYLSGYQPYEIAEKRCTKCGDCVKVCPVNAIEIITEKEAVQAV
jgi:NAD-dependent dihydropyrimidine dehydrogenase PreA subunit